MGFLDSLTNAFTGKPAMQAAQQTRNYLTGVQGQGNIDITQGFNTATGAINTGTDAARAALGQGYNTATGATNAGATGAINYIGQGSGGALGRLDQAGGQYAPLAALGQKYGAGTNLYLDALGVNGPQGNTRATDAFQAGPGYNFTLNEGIDAINRRRAAGGMLASGNADRDATNYATGLANTTYNDWRNSLGNLISPELSATSGTAAGRAGIDVNAANLINSTGTSKAAIESGRGSMLADLASRYGTGGAGLETGAGNTLAGLSTGAAGQRVGLAGSLASPYANTYGQEAAAQQQGSANLWGLGLNLAKLGVGGYGSVAGAGGPQTGGLTANGWGSTGGYNPNVAGGYVYPGGNPSWLSSLWG